MSKSKKWSIIVAALATVTGGGAGGFAYTQGYLTGGDGGGEQVADGDKAAKNAGAEDAHDATTAESDGTSDSATSADLAEGESANAAPGTTMPAGDPFARADVTPLAPMHDDPNYGATTDDVVTDASTESNDDGIPAAEAAFAGIEPVEPPAGDLADPSELAEPTEPAGTSDAGLSALTPPADPQAIGEAPRPLTIPADTPAAVYEQQTAGEDAYGASSTTGADGAQQYADSQRTDNQYGDQYGAANDNTGDAASAAAALAAGVGAAALSAGAADDSVAPAQDYSAANNYDAANDYQAPNDYAQAEEPLAADSSTPAAGNPLRSRYGDAYGDTLAETQGSATAAAAAPATPIDAAGASDGVNEPATDYAAESSQVANDPYGQQPYAQPYSQPPVEPQTDIAAQQAPRSDYAFTRRADAKAAPAAPLVPVTETDERGIYAQSAAAGVTPVANPPYQYGADDGTTPGDTAGDSDVGMAADSTGLGQPGPAQLEGVQQTSVSIEKRPPVEAQVGRKAVWEIFVRNTGSVTAQGVAVHDDVPRGATLSRTYPQAEAADGHIVWTLGSLEPGEERRLELEIIPQVEGDMGSVARVVVGTQATARATVTKPQLQIEAAAPEEVLIGSLARLVIKVSNVGTGVAHAVRLEEQVPELFKHPGGQRLIYEVGDLGPKQVRELDLMLTATKAGVTDNVLRAQATGDFTAEKTSRVEVVAPKLEVHFSGPTKRYLQREGTFTLTLNNPGTATAHEVQLAAHVPDGLEFVDANNSGYYDPTTRTVHWLLSELPPGQPAEVKLSARAVRAGSQPLVVESTTPQGLRAELTQPIDVEGLAAVSFEVRDVQDPVEVGGRTAYEIRVINQGSKAATNVSVSAEIPPTMKAVDASGPSRHTLEAGRVVFAPLPRLAPRADTTYTIEVEAVRAGDSRLRVELASNEVSTPVTRDEPTVVFSDE